MRHKKLLSIILASFLALSSFAPFAVAIEKFRPATLFDGPARVAVYSKAEADYYFGLGYKLEFAPALGVAIPIVVANFETSLASGITSTATSSMTLVSGTTGDGTSLSGLYGFIIDAGSSNQEYVLATCSGTSCTGLTRGISTITGNTSVTALQMSHRRGATVKITDHPILVTLARILNGQETTPGGLTFGSGYITGVSTPISASSTSVANVAYVNNSISAGGVVATESVSGISILASKSQMAAGTATSTYNSIDYSLVLQSKNANATSSATTTIPVTNSSGKLSSGFIDQTANYTWSGSNTYSGTSTFSGTTNFGAVSLGTTTFSVNPILATSSYTTVNSAVATTVPHYLGVIPFKIDFDINSFDSSNNDTDGIGNGSWTYISSTASSTNTSAQFTSSYPFSYSTNRASNYFNTGIIYTHFAIGNGTPAELCRTYISAVSTSTFSINTTGTCTAEVRMNWTAYGVRQ